MIRKIAQKEFLEIVREGRFRIAFIILLVLTIIAIGIGRQYYQSVQQQHTQAKENARNIWVSQDEKNPHSAAHYGTYAFKPKYPLSLIDQGVDKYTGISIFLEAHNRNEAQFMSAADQTGLARFGDMTPDFILLFLLPLLIIATGFNAFTKEKENGTLSLLKSQGVSLSKLAVGKWLGVFAPVFILITLAFALAGVLLAVLPDFGEFSFSSLLLLYGVFLIFYAVFTNLTLIVSLLARNSSQALVALIGLWILVCLAAPKAASNLADRLYPYPSRQEFAAEVALDKKKGLDGHNPWSKEAKLLEKNVLEEYGVDSVQQLPFNFDGYRMQKGEEHEAQVYFKHYSHLKAQFRKQSGVYQAIALISPFLPTRFLSMAIARTDYDTHWDFSDAAENYRLELQNALNTNFAENSSYGEWAYKADRSLWSDIPEFSYSPPPIQQIIQRNAFHLGLLFLWLGLSFWLLITLSKRL